MILKGESAEEFNRKADENYEKFKAKQKQNLIDMTEADEELGLYTPRNTPEMKKYYRIGTMILVLGWIPLMVLAVAGAFLNPWVATILFLIGVCVCAFGALTTLILGTSNEFWLCLEQVKEKEQELMDAKIKYNMARKKLEKAVLKFKE